MCRRFKPTHLGHVETIEKERGKNCTGVEVEQGWRDERTDGWLCGGTNNMGETAEIMKEEILTKRREPEDACKQLGGAN